jgi:DNA polymerase III subunit delta
MKLRVEQLAAHLQSGVRPIYHLSGDEPLQMKESVDMIRKTARAAGFLEREVLDVESGFEWGSLAAATDNLSLFSERKIVEVRMGSPKPGDEGAKALVSYTQTIPDDTVLLITMGKMEAAQGRSKWAKALESTGVAMNIWPIDRSALPAWIIQRGKVGRLDIPREVAIYIANLVEGNMLAAAQEIEKLALLYLDAQSASGSDVAAQKIRLTIEQVEQAVGQASRYTIFTLVDDALAGEIERVVRVMDGLQQEGEDAVKVLWALEREIRTLVSMAEALEQGKTIPQIIKEYHVWQKRVPLVQAALQRHHHQRWQLLQVRAGRVDRILKGADSGNPWDELLQLALMIAGIRIV